MTISMIFHIAGIVSILISSISSSSNVCLDNVLFHRTDAILPSTGPFCVVRKTADDALPDVAPIQSIEQFEQLGYDWTDKQEPLPTPLVHVSGPGGPAPFLLPASIFGPYCSGTQFLPIGVNISTSCISQWLVFNATECTQSRFFSAQELFGPSVVTRSKTLFVETPFRSLPGADIRQAEWRNGNCEHVIEKATLTFSLNGSLVTDAVVSRVNYVTLSANNYTQLAQRFEVRFVKALNDADQAEVEDFGMKEGDPIHIVKGSSIVPLRLPSLEDCITGRRIPIMFLSNVTTGCTFRIAGCQDAQMKSKQFYESLVADYVFASGNLSVEPLTVLARNISFPGSATDNSCTLVMWQSMRILYARQGTESSFYHEIVGMIYEYTTDEVTVNPNISLPIPMSVQFIDVTNAPIKRFSGLPHVDLSLPSDFFYPFVYSSGCPVKYYIVFAFYVLSRLLNE